MGGFVNKSDGRFSIQGYWITEELLLLHDMVFSSILDTVNVCQGTDQTFMDLSGQIIKLIVLIDIGSVFPGYWN